MQGRTDLTDFRFNVTMILAVIADCEINNLKCIRDV